VGITEARIVSRKVRGVDAKTGFLLGDAISRERITPPDKPTARCNRCGQPLRATPAILGPIRMGIVEHKDCGGQFEELNQAGAA
jgi:hypothetical protein